MNVNFNKIVYFENLYSSNNYLINLSKMSPTNNQWVVVAENQTKGKGRMGKRWFANQDSLAFSFSLCEHVNNWHINMTVSLVLIQLLDKYGVSAMIKYPNDIIVHNKKIAGILIESIVHDNKKKCIVGIGLNVNNELFPQNIPHAVSMKNITSKTNDKHILLKYFLEKFSALADEKVLYKRYLKKLYGFNNYVQCLYEGSEITCKILSVTKQGFLTIMIKEKSIITVNSEDVKFIIY